MNILPSILNYLTQKQKETISFVRPGVGNEITERCLSDGHDSPAAKNALIKNLILKQSQVVPFHWQDREKLYIYRGGGRVDVFILKDGIMRKYWLDTEGDILVIPQGCPHAVFTNLLPVEITVIMYPVYPINRTVVTGWEPATEELVLNEHLCAAD